MPVWHPSGDREWAVLSLSLRLAESDQRSFEPTTLDEITRKVGSRRNGVNSENETQGILPPDGG